jgi:hypothetical protein
MLKYIKKFPKKSIKITVRTIRAVLAQIKSLCFEISTWQQFARVIIGA